MHIKCQSPLSTFRERCFQWQILKSFLHDLLTTISNEEVCLQELENPEDMFLMYYMGSDDIQNSDFLLMWTYKGDKEKMFLCLFIVNMSLEYIKIIYKTKNETSILHSQNHTVLYRC